MKRVIAMVTVMIALAVVPSALKAAICLPKFCALHDALANKTGNRGIIPVPW